MTQADVFGLVAAGIIFVSEAIYIRSMFVVNGRGERTRPSRSTFWVWTFVQGLMAASYIASGEGFAAGISVAYAVCFLAIAVLSIKYGYGKWERMDTYCFLATAAAALLWVATRNPVLTLAATVAIDFAGAYPTLKKSWADPGTESRTAWMLTVVATALNFAAVQEWGLADIVYNPYLLAINGAITYAIWRPRKQRAV